MKPELDLDECRLVLALAQLKSVDKVAVELGRDRTVISRKLLQIEAKYPVVSKQGNRWFVTPKGLELCRWTLLAVGEQRRILQQDAELRIGTVRDFAEFKVSPKLKHIRMKCEVKRVSVLSSLSNIENALLQGEIDIAISCQIPIDPSIRRKKLIKGPMIPIALRSFAIPIRKNSDVSGFPFLEHENLPFRRLFPNSPKEPEISFRFDSIGAIRGAIIAGLGWSVLPKYAVARELEEKTLVQLDLPSEGLPTEEFSIAWLKESRFAASKIEHLISCLK